MRRLQIHLEGNAEYPSYVNPATLEELRMISPAEAQRLLKAFDGNALVRYRGFEQQGFVLRAIFEAEAAKFGANLTDTHINGVPIYDVRRLEELLPALNVQMAILAVPAEAAQGLVNRLAELGISGILNFAPVSLSIPERVQSVDVTAVHLLQQIRDSLIERDAFLVFSNLTHTLPNGRNIAEFFDQMELTTLTEHVKVFGQLDEV